MDMSLLTQQDMTDLFFEHRQAYNFLHERILYREWHYLRKQPSLNDWQKKRLEDIESVMNNKETNSHAKI